MSTWPPTDIPAFYIDGLGVHRVLIRTPSGAKHHTISLKRGIRVRNADTGLLEREWSLTIKHVWTADLFATEDGARAAFDARRATRKAA